tara:strand:+ start:1847 stop:2686 length:840 start_codon:yes stop_codon:yes gene_type:complete
MHKVGYMQGRLSEIIDGKIQAFPINTWKEEIIEGSKNNLGYIEWTLDHQGLAENPFITKHGQNEIKSLSEINDTKILSVTGDCFMQAPIWKLDKAYEKDLTNEFLAVIDACHQLDVGIVVVPCVDSSAIETQLEEKKFLDFCCEHYQVIKDAGVRIAIESDFEPSRLDHFIRKLPNDVFGINYDIGNSASLGFSHKDEITTYGDLIYNVHVKDRPLGGTTVPLGEGDSNFREVFRSLFLVGYHGDFILQTARAKENNHLDVLLKYKNYTELCITKYFTQ